MSPVLTVAEVAALLEQTDGPDALSRRAIRYYAKTGMVEATGRLEGRTGSRLYTIADMAVLRLAWLLKRRFHMSDRGVWAVLVLQGDAIRRQIADGKTITFEEPASLLWRGPEDQRHQTRKERKDLRRRVSMPIRIHLTLLMPPMLVRLAEETRANTPGVWTGSGFVSAREAAEQISS